MKATFSRAQLEAVKIALSADSLLGKEICSPSSFNSIIQTSRRSSSSHGQISDLDGAVKPVEIFDRKLKSVQRSRAARLTTDEDPLLIEVTDRLLDRLKDCKRSFPTALTVGGAISHVKNQLKNTGGIQRMTFMDSSLQMLDRCKRDPTAESSSFTSLAIVGDEEFFPFKKNSLDLIISPLSLHWVNDLPGTLAQYRMALCPDGLFLGAMFGGDTIRELRVACTVAQQEREGGISPRLSPLARVRDAGSLLTTAGFSMPAVDVDTVTVRYPSAMEVIEHLRSMGESNAVLNRSLSLRRDTALATASIYQALFGYEDGSVPATFQVIFLAGWSPHESHLAPKARGSAPLSFHSLRTELEKKGGESS